VPVPGDAVSGPDRCWQDQMDDAVETERIPCHLRRPIPGCGDLLMNAGNTVHEIDP